MKKSIKIAVFASSLLTIIAIATAIVKTATNVKTATKSKTTWQFVPGSVETGDTFKAVKHGLTQKEYTIKICGIEAPDIEKQSGIESKEFLTQILENSGELKIEFNQYSNENRDILPSEVYLVKDNKEDKISLAKKLITSGKAQAENMSYLLGMYNTCFVNQEELESIQELLEIQRARQLQQTREQELAKQKKETEKEATMVFASI